MSTSRKFKIIFSLSEFCCGMKLVTTNKKQEGWLSPTERASVSVISLRHILASPGTIAVNVTWMERGFNAGQM